MRDISGRLGRYRLSRYAPPEDPMRRPLRWLWVGLAAWLVWVCFLSDHGFLRLWQLARDDKRTRVELAKTEHAADRLAAELHDPVALRGLAERVLREKNGMARPGEIVYRIRSPKDSLTRE